MRNVVPRQVSRWLLLLLSAALLDCGDADNPLSPEHFPVLDVSGEFIVVPDTSLLVVGMTRRLAVEETAALNAYEGRADWTTSNASVATVDAAGYVQAVGEGQAIISVTTNGRSASAPVYVQRYSAPLQFVQVSTGIWHACGLTREGAIYCWGYGGSGQLGTTRPADSCESRGRDRYGNYWRATDRCSAVPVQIESNEVFTTVAASGFGACALNRAGKLFCWGSGLDPSGLDSKTPRGTGGQHIYASVSPPCALTTDGEAYCWGRNDEGILGTGSITTPAQASSDDPALVSGGRTWKSIDSGGGTACGIASDNATYCWGLNNYYQLGIGADTTPQECRAACRTAPTKLATPAAFKEISVGEATACALTAQREAYCWGYRYHRLDEADPSWMVPTSLGSTRYAMIASGNFETCAMSLAGDTACWGAGGAAAPVLPTSLDPKELGLPVALRTMTKPSSWAACGIGTDGLVYCFGSPLMGMLGDGVLPSMGIRATPDSSALPRVGAAVVGQR
jgi:hypothetical protein